MTNRTIKFRARMKDGSIDYVFELKVGKNIFLDPTQIVAIDQFTGLLDKNGKEIYEGDVVKADGKNALVEWNKSEPFYWVRFGNNKFNYLWDVLDIEVIGNIWEHPDLLSQEKTNAE